MRATRHITGITLIELIAVMAVLAVLLAIIAPSLSAFNKGRTLTEETRRMLALIHCARSEAASRGEAMDLWLDAEQGTYGLTPKTQYGYGADEQRLLEFELATGLLLELDEEAYDADGLAHIVFLPNGVADEQSAEQVTVQHENGESLVIAQASNGTKYIVQTETEYEEMMSDRDEE